MTKQEFVISWFRKRPNKKFSNSELEKLLRQDYETDFGGGNSEIHCERLEKHMRMAFCNVLPKAQARFIGTTLPSPQ